LKNKFDFIVTIKRDYIVLNLRCNSLFAYRDFYCIYQIFGVKVQVDNLDDSKLADNDITIAAAGRE
jgi:hypothetical protein